MARQWTPNQKNAIYATDGSVLVSAAAGSGKTAVLVERVIKMITRADNPVDADRLLIVTFTRAAAAEMKQRISAALNELIENDPYNPQLIKQKQLLYNASISTIDSFCGDIVREYFHTLGVTSDFRIADDGELDLLRKTALDKTLERFYTDSDGKFFNLLNAFASKNGDTKLRETILKICDFLSTQPFRDVWFENMLKNYTERSVAHSLWGKIIIDYAVPVVSHMINLTENSIKISSDDEKLFQKFLPILEDDLSYLNSLKIKLLGDSWDEMYDRIHSFSAGRLTAPRGYKDNPIKVKVSENRKEVKSEIDKLKKYFCRTEAQARDEYDELESIVETLFEVVMQYITELDELKNKKNILSFSDIELLTVRLLAEPDEEIGYIKTQIAYEISKRFDAVIVDEFQDVNDVQNLIFNCVSTEENNLFVVGDVKQSIYGFRQAKPKIFIDRKEKYNKFNEISPQYPATIILDKNFRSREEVCETVNFIFSNLMTKESAQMDYSVDERLNVGAVYPETTACDTELIYIDKEIDPNLSSAELEASYIAQKIRKMIGKGFLVTDGSAQRPATYGDFAILLRSTSSTANAYVNQLISCGIPARCDNKENAFEAQEVKTLLNLLRIIDNPSLDIPLLSVLCSPLYGFTPDELAEMRADSRKKSLYFSLKRYAGVNDKAKNFLSDLTALRQLACTCGVDELIGRIYETTAIGAVTAAVKGGEYPLRNLNLLRVYARSYEANGYKTLSDFIYYIDRLIENGTQLPDAGGASDNLNCVTVMSIHKSKGLEFPVCFLGGTAKKFNRTDLFADVLIDSVAGLGIKHRKGILAYNTIPRLAVELEIKGNETAEELRILYVALTRAREKLILLSTVKNVTGYIEKMETKLVFDSIIDPYTVINSNSFSDWITMTALVNPSTRKTLLDSYYGMITQKSPPDWIGEIISSADQLLMTDTAEAITDSLEIKLITDTDYAEILKYNLNFKYKNQNILTLPQKVTASEISHNRSSNYFDRIIAKPLFVKSVETSAVERGTAHHTFLQYCDFQKARENLDSEIERLQSIDRLTVKQTEYIDREGISRLLSTPLFDRIMASPAVYREEHFFAKIPPAAVSDDYYDIDTDEKIIMQGAVDLAFEENGKLVIVDYKTDRVREIKKLVSLYKKQLDLYKLALEQSFELEVSECIICSVHLNKYIEV